MNRFKASSWGQHIFKNTVEGTCCAPANSKITELSEEDGKKEGQMGRKGREEERERKGSFASPALFIPF